MTRESHIAYWRENARGGNGCGESNSFVNHVATRHDYEPFLTVIDWRNRDGSNAYSVRYVFDGSALIVRGDLGEAIFNRCGNVPALEWLGDMRDFVYMSGKLLCATDRWDYDRSIWETDFDEWAGQAGPSLEAVREIKDVCGEWEENCRGALFASSVLQKEFDAETIAEVADFGKVYSARFILWIEGLKMALEQLKAGGHE
jgi:hypothetical protein